MATDPPDSDFLAVIAEGREALIRGNGFIVAKDYSAAYGELFIVDYLTDHRMFGIAEALELLSKLRWLSLDIQIRQSQQNQHAEAAAWAHRAWATAIIVGWGKVSDVGKAHIKFRLGQALFDDEKSNHAVRELQYAHGLDPNNEQLEKLSEKAKANVLKQKKHRPHRAGFS